QAVTLHSRAVALAQQLGEPGLLVESLTALGAAEHQAGHVKEAEQRYQQALDLVRHRQDRSAEAVLLNNLGLLRQAMGEDEQADQLLRQAMALNQAAGNGESEASNHVNLGLLAEARHQYDVAEREYERALELDRVGERRSDIAADLLRLGRVADRGGIPDRALAYFERAYRSYLAQGDVPHAASALTQAAECAGKAGRMQEVARWKKELDDLKSSLSVR
ncbi:MAG: tetratricopeptide repeat protein, partial [Nitrospira sp.]